MSFAKEFRIRSFKDVRRALLEREEIALVDVREEDPHARSHPLFAANLSLSRLELEAPVRLPRRDVPVVVLDDGEGLAERAARRLSELGYTEVALLEGGLQGWREAGGELFQDVNVPSKAFGELVESERHTPLTGSAADAGAARSRSRCGGARRTPFRRIPDHEYSRQHQRARRGTGAARPAARAESRHTDHRQLRGAHAQHHRCAVADQCGRAESGCCAAQWHHRLDACRSGARARQLAPLRSDCR